MREQFGIFCTAVMFFTRLPVAGLFEYKPEYATQAARYFPLVGLLIGVLVSGVFSLLISFFPLTVALILTFAVSVLLTGGFHEDGFADMCDGFGGAWEKERVLSIMKDSRLGTYGALGLMLLMAAKFIALLEVGQELIPLALITAHIVSRVVATSLIYSYDYVQDEDAKKINALSMHLSTQDLWLVLVMGALSLIWLPLKGVVLMIVALFVLRYLFGRFLYKKIGGYTGDCLGGMQQLSELCVYLTLLLVL